MLEGLVREGPILIGGPTYERAADYMGTHRLLESG